MPRLLRQLTPLARRPTLEEVTDPIVADMAAAEDYIGNCRPIFPGLDEDEAALASMRAWKTMYISN